MSQENLKVKVILSYSVMATVVGLYFAPELVKAVMPFAACVLLAVFILYAPDIMAVITENLKTRRRFGMASRAFRVKGSSEVTVRVTSVPAIDYENYLIPTYMRRQEVK